MFPVFNVLTDDDVKRIDEASLNVLEKTGVFLSHPKAHEVLSGLGAKISDDKKKVFFPRDLINDMVKKTPSSFICGAREPEFDLDMKQGNMYMRMVAGAVCSFNLCENTEKPMTYQDNMNAGILINSLPNIDIACALSPQDINPATYDIAVVKGLFENCHKHFWALTVHSKHLEYELKMAEAVAGGREALKARPLISGIFCVNCPMRYPSDEIERLMLYGQYGIPVRVPMAPLIGGSSPYTLAGSLTQINAEFLSSVTIIQALCPGLGTWYRPNPQILDMRNGLGVYNGPELMLVASAIAQMARHYKVPSTFPVGNVTGSQSHQAVFHTATAISVATMQQITEQGAVGAIQGSYYFSTQALVMCDEFKGYFKAFSQGIDVNDETLAVDDIHNCFDKGEYVSSKLTLKYLRKEKHYAPTVLDWRQYGSWCEDPSTIVDRAEAKVQKILKDPDIRPLPSDKQAELDDLMKAAEKEFS